MSKLKVFIQTLTGTGKEQAESIKPQEFKIEEFDHMSPDVVQRPYPHYEAIRKLGPVQYVPKYGYWIVVDYDPAVEASRRVEVFSSEIEGSIDSVLIGRDPPEHTAVRKLLSPFFTATALSDLQSVIRTTCEELLEQVQVGSDSHFDIVSQYAIPLTEVVMGHIIGLNEEEKARLRSITSKDRYHIGYLPELDAFLLDFLNASSSSSKSEFVRALESSDLNQSEVLSLLRILWVAGTATTGMTITSSCNILLRQESVFAEIKDRMELIPKFIEEVLRFESPAISTWRKVTSDTVFFDTFLSKDSRVRICFSAANRDPKHFDRADVFDLHRTPNDHLAFGSGSHSCLGAVMARMEAKIALETLIKRFPNMKAFAPSESELYVESDHFRALEKFVIVPS